MGWAGLTSVEQTSRGQYVNARHLAFLEKFLGQDYAEIYSGEPTAAFMAIDPATPIPPATVSIISMAARATTSSAAAPKAMC